ncbi:MAG: NADH-quinone oxidoreductase subunit H [Planctomycetota bacterium]
MDYTALDFLATLIKAIAVIFVALQIVPGCIYFERKIAAYVQGRLGPNRVNFEVGHLRYLLPRWLHGAIPEGVARVKLIPGSLQPLADAIKLLFKEEIVPRNADKLLWYMAPALAFIPVGTALAFLPFGATWEFGPTNLLGIEIGHHTIEMSVANVVPGVLFLLAISSLSVYGIACGGWGSGSKYPLMGAVRAAAQMISYEVPLGIALVIALVSAGSVDGQEIVRDQAESWGGFGWLLFRQPLAAFIFLVAMFAENNRLPFDLPEAEPELVGGYHTEYSGLKFALFFLGEYCAMILMCGLFVTLFMGGWSLPALLPATGLALPARLILGGGSGLIAGLLIANAFSGGRSSSLMGSVTVVACFALGLVAAVWPGVQPSGGFVNAVLSILVFSAKLLAVLWLQLWIRWTLPRFRYDQLMNLGWKVMTPLALVNLAVTAIVISAWPNFRFLA